jgi:hypothetical protein
MIVNKSTDLDLKVTFDYFLIDLQDLDLLGDLEPPRVFVTHYPFDLLPSSVKDRRTKLVHVYRNPKSSFVSNRCMIQSLNRSL